MVGAPLLEGAAELTADNSELTKVVTEATSDEVTISSTVAEPTILAAEDSKADVDAAKLSMVAVAPELMIDEISDAEVAPADDALSDTTLETTDDSATLIEVALNTSDEAVENSEIEVAVEDSAAPEEVALIDTELAKLEASAVLDTPAEEEVWSQNDVGITKRLCKRQSVTVAC